jgi:DNA-binding NarL/FixJ family response regulator
VAYAPCQAIDEVLQAIAAVHAGEIVITTALAGLAEVAEHYGELPALTPRQRQVLSRRARGETFQQIACRLGVSRKTAEEHMADVSGKFVEYLRHHATTPPPTSYATSDSATATC